jgi:dihydropteroate synthase
MSILNVTPDSFADGGSLADEASLLAHAQAQLAAGATVLDVGGESTRPGARTLPASQEVSRVLPALDALRQHLPHATLSIDTRKAAVAQAALEAGATWVNDVSGLRYDGEAMAKTVAEAGATLVLMHSVGSPATMQLAPSYGQRCVVLAVYEALARQCEQAVAWGVSPDRLWVDVGFGFGKTVDDNIALLKGLGRFKVLGYPMLVGVSRKSFLAKAAGVPQLPPAHRDALTALAHLPAFEVYVQGLPMGFRVHNVATLAPCWQAYAEILNEPRGNGCVVSYIGLS